MKKLNVIVGVLVAAVIVVLVVLLVMTFFRDEQEFLPTSSPTPPVSTATPTPEPPDNGSETPLPSPDTDGNDPVTPDNKPIEGERIGIPALTLGREMLVVTYNSELYSHIKTEIGQLFFLLSDSSNETFIEIVFIEADLELRKAGFLDAYIPDFTSMDTLGQVTIAGSSVVAEGLSATNGTNYADAWLVEVTGGFFAVVAGYNDDAGRAELYKMLDTIDFTM